MVANSQGLPATPPASGRRIELNEAQRRQAVQLVTDLAVRLGALPAVLSQGGEVTGAAETTDAQTAGHLARVADAIWRARANNATREAIRFREERAGSGNKQMAFLVYSAHVAGALTLSVGWQRSISLGRLRAEAGKTRRALQQLLALDPPQ